MESVNRLRRFADFFNTTYRASMGQTPESPKIAHGIQARLGHDETRDRKCESGRGCIQWHSIPQA